MNVLFLLECLYFSVKIPFWIYIAVGAYSPAIRVIAAATAAGLAVFVIFIKPWKKKSSRHVEAIILTILLPVEAQCFSHFRSLPPPKAHPQITWNCSKDFVRELNSTIKIIPLVEDAIVQGWVITRINPRGPWSRLGFKEKDVIESVNGKKPVTQETFLECLSEFCTPQFSFEVRRGGQTLTIRTMASQAVLR